MTHLVSRSAVLAVLSVVAVAALAGPALAHGRGSDATNFRSRILAEPDIPDTAFEVLGAGEFLWVRNDSDEELTIFGYEGDEYLRVGPDGVFRNANSPATYLNQTRLAQDAPAPPPSATAGAEPKWVKLSDEPEFAWTDHRIHWESPLPRPDLLAATDVVEVQGWTVPLRYGGAKHDVEGVLEWVPSPTPAAVLAVALLVTLSALLGLRAGNDPSVPGWVHRAARPAALVLGIVSLANLAQLYDDFFALPLPLGQAALKGLQTALFIVIGLFGAVRGWQGRDGAFAALGVGSIAIFIGQGLLYWPALSASQTSSAFPPMVSRVVIALSLAQLVGVGLIALWGNSRIAKAEGDAVPAAPEPSV